MRQLGRVIAASRAEIERRWVARVQADIARTPAAKVTNLRDGIPNYLAALADLLEAGGSGDETAESVWRRIAQEHGITRVRSGFDLTQLVHEFKVLRQEIRAVALEHGVGPVSFYVLADLIESAIVESVRAYVSARDYETRRVQAENVAFLTHELKNPLSAAMGAAELIQLRAVPEQEQPLALLTRSHRRLYALVENFLEVERLEADQVQVHIETISEADLLEGAMEAARKQAEAKGLLLAVHCIPEREVQTDVKLTRSAVQNLVDNAVKYTDDGQVEVVTKITETRWELHVSDTCPGLSPEELRTIFKPFRRGKTAKKGTGLGLAIAKRAVEVQGGDIHAESPGVVGCHFWISLPRHPNERTGVER